jgi:hypothetical protein
VRQRVLTDGSSTPAMQSGDLSRRQVLAGMEVADDSAAAEVEEVLATAAFVSPAILPVCDTDNVDHPLSIPPPKANL